MLKTTRYKASLHNMSLFKTTYINRVQNSKLVVVQKLLLEPTGSQVCIILINSGSDALIWNLPIIRLADIIIHISAYTDNQSNVYVKSLN